MIKCNLIDTDMGTFMCPNRCDEFCKPAPKCKPDPFWVKQIKNGRPGHWPNSSEIAVGWSEADKKALLTALGQLPDDLKVRNLEGIFRLGKSIEIGNPGTEIDGAISLYDRAFGGPYSLGRVIAHELAHLSYDSLSLNQKNDYMEKAGWIRPKADQPLKPSEDRKFVDRDASSSPEEDFAHNLDTYLFDPERLKVSVPEVYEWISKNFSKNFALKKDCKHDK